MRNKLSRTFGKAAFAGISMKGRANSHKHTSRAEKRVLDLFGAATIFKGR